MRRLSEGLTGELGELLPSNDPEPARLTEKCRGDESAPAADGIRGYLDDSENHASS